VVGGLNLFLERRRGATGSAPRVGENPMRCDWAICFAKRGTKDQRCAHDQLEKKDTTGSCRLALIAGIHPRISVGRENVWREIVVDWRRFSREK
jgi:hypothetical protein